MYNVIIYLIQVGVAIASLFSDKVRKMWRGEQESFRILREKINPADRYIWFHAASLGEFEQGRPLMEEVRRQHPEYKILLTFFSPSGYEVRKDYKGADVICYLPIDTIGNARKFLRIVRPVMAFFIKYEFWYNFLHVLKHRGIPTYSVSSIFRPEQIFFKWYGWRYSRVLTCFTRFFVQNDGPAIAEKDLPHIFERFYTADKAHTSGSGTGLGLSICSLILREHHSEIRVRSVPGDTCFEFDLPAAEAPLPRAVPELPGKSEEDS